MHASTILMLAAAGFFAAAQTTVDSGCGSQIDDIISSCLGTETAQLASCATNDWDCMCTQQTNVVTCYNNCPGDPERQTAVDQQTSWCDAAAAYGTSTSLRPTATPTTAASSDGSTSTPSATGESVIPESGVIAANTASSAAPAAASQTGAAAHVAVGVAAPGVFAALVGMMALL